jgi:RNA-splicing ligase RtcB
MTKSKPLVKIVNCETGEEIVRDATAEEIAQMELSVAHELRKQAEIEARETQRQVILDRLGLTSEEARLLLGS